jgi:8-oxo-dGTP pyrophosphatase MutT (NUDIX family)
MENFKYKGSIIEVSEEEIGGIVWERAYLPHGVIIFPITEEGKIILIEEKRPHENPPSRIKPVSGILELDKGSALENAQRELQEEIGLKALDLQELMVLDSTGTVNSRQYFYVGRNLVKDKLPNPDGEDIILRTIELTPSELKEKLFNGELKWSLSTLGIFKLLESLR